MLRDYRSCVENNYSAEEYAAAWADDLYNEICGSAVEYFWGNHMNIPDELVDKVEISETVESECREGCFEAYKAAYERYQVEHKVLLDDSDDIFEEWEIDDIVRETVEVLSECMGESLKKVLEEAGCAEEYGEI